MSLNAIPFKVPLEYLAQVEAGEMVRYGTILKSAADGRIVAHLQETGVFGQVLGLATSGVGEVAGSALSPVGMLANVGTLVQNEQIKGRLSTLTDMVGNLQTLSLVGSVASVAGIGVTVASTAILAQRINKVDQSISRLGGQVSGLEEKLDKLDVHRALRNIEDTMEKLAEAPFRKTQSGTEKVLGDVEENLRSGFNELTDGVRVVLGFDVLDGELLRTLLAGLASCAAAQSKTLIWLDEVALAQTRAQSQAQKINALGKMMPLDVLEVKLGTHSETAARLSADMRELRAVAASRPSFCETLGALEISGPDYLAQTAERDDEAVLILPSN